MSVVVNATFKARDGSFDDLVAYMTEILPETARYDGAELISCYTDPKTGTVFLHEVWTEKAKQEAYLMWRSETGVVDRIVGMLREPPIFEDRTHVPI